MKKNKTKQIETELIREQVLTQEELFLLEFLKGYKRQQAKGLTYEIEQY